MYVYILPIYVSFDIYSDYIIFRYNIFYITYFSLPYFHHVAPVVTIADSMYRYTNYRLFCRRKLHNIIMVIDTFLFIKYNLKYVIAIRSIITICKLFCMFCTEIGCLHRHRTGPTLSELMIDYRLEIIILYVHHNASIQLLRVSRLVYIIYD